MSAQTTDFIRQKLKQVVDQYGGWTDHNIKLAPNLYTIERRRPSPKLRRILQVVNDLAGKPLSSLRVLDLGCLEGGYAIELALHGAQVIGIEGRQANIAKAQAVKDILELHNLSFHKSDVRKISPEDWGYFDVVLCLGVFYHVESGALFDFAERIAQCCTRLAIFDTETSTEPRKAYLHGDHTYYGRDVIEHDPKSCPEERLQELWGSLDNSLSTWLTPPSLLNLLHRSGFSSIYKCDVPIEPGKRDDRLTIVALKSSLVGIRSVDDDSDSVLSLPEWRRPRVHKEQNRFFQTWRWLVLKVPRPWRKRTKAILKSLRLFRKQPRPWELPWQIRHTSGQPGHADMDH